MLTWNNEVQDIGDVAVVATQGTCKSTDTKPTNVGNGSILLEMDTATMYLFDAESKVWRAWV